MLEGHVQSLSTNVYNKGGLLRRFLLHLLCHSPTDISNKILYKQVPCIVVFYEGFLASGLGVTNVLAATPKVHSECYWFKSVRETNE